MTTRARLPWNAIQRNLKGNDLQSYTRGKRAFKNGRGVRKNGGKYWAAGYYDAMGSDV